MLALAIIAFLVGIAFNIAHRVDIGRWFLAAAAVLFGVWLVLLVLGGNGNGDIDLDTMRRLYLT